MDRRQYLLSELRHAELWLADVTMQVQVASKKVATLVEQLAKETAP